MPLEIGKPYIETKEDLNPSNQTKKKYRVCVMVHNPSNAVITKCWTLYSESTSNNPQNIKLPEVTGKFKLRAKIVFKGDPAKGFGKNSLTEGDMLCTEYWPGSGPSSNRKYYVWIGDTKNTAGHVEPKGAGNVRGEPLIIQERIVRTRAGSKVSYSALIGSGIVEDFNPDTVTIDVLNALPRGWTLEVPEQIDGDDLEFTVRPRAGADEDEFGIVEVRTFVEGNDRPIDETSVMFMAESALQPAIVTENNSARSDLAFREPVLIASLNGNGRGPQVDSVRTGVLTAKR